MISKRGNVGEGLFGLTSFMILLSILGIGIIVSIYILFGSVGSSKDVGSQTLNFEIQRCLKENSISDFQKDFFNICNLNKKVLEEANPNSLFLIKVCEGTDYNACVDDSNPKISVGGSVQSCLFRAVKENENFPVCKFGFVSTFYGKNYVIITGSNQNPTRGVYKYE